MLKLINFLLFFLKKLMLFLYFYKMEKLGWPELVQVNLLYLWHIIYSGSIFKLNFKTKIKLPIYVFIFLCDKNHI
jgi:hypothetical protein